MPSKACSLHGAAALLAGIAERDLLLPGAVQDDLLRALGQRLERGLDVEAVVLGEAGEHREIELVAPVPAADRPAGERQVREGHHPLGIEERDLAQPVAARAGAHGIVEREEPRLELGDRVAARGAREARGEEVLPARVHLHRERAPVGVAQRRLERLGQALREPGARRPALDLHAVDHDLDGVLAVAVQARQLVDLVDLAVDAQADEPLGAQLVEELRLLALAPDHQGRQDHHPRALGQRQHVVDHLRHALRGELHAVLGAVGIAHAREEQPQVVVDLGHRADGGARVVGGRLLLDGDRGRQALDQVHVGLLHELQELARVGGERLHVAALALGVKRVERERGLPRSGESGDHHEAVARDVEADIPEVVRARAADSDRFHRAIC